MSPTQPSNLFPRPLLKPLLVLPLLLGGLALPAPASAGDGGGRLVVDTQFWERPNRVVEATGRLASCRRVVDLQAREPLEIQDGLLFRGVKAVVCDEGYVVLRYRARLWYNADYRTRGSWRVLLSSLPRVRAGDTGRLAGDARRCTPRPRSDGCIRDTLTLG